MNKIQELFEGLSEEERKLQFGYMDTQTGHVSFGKKRTVHAGVSGGMLPPTETQAVWEGILKN